MNGLKRENQAEWMVIGTLMLAKILIHLLNPEYGYFRDEFFYMAIADQFSFSNWDVLPLTPLYLKLMMTLFGTSLKAIHFASALAGAFLILITCKMARELGGNLFAIFLAGFTSLLSGQLIFGALFSYDSLDFLIQATSMYLLILIFKRSEPRLWILLGVVLGMGFLNKLTILFFGLALLIGFLATKQRRFLATRWPWITAAIALVFAIPFVIWQIVNDWYFIGVARIYSGGIAYVPTVLEYIWAQFLPHNPATALVWIPGLFALFFVRRFSDFRFFAVAFAFLYVFFYFIGAKFYFIMPMFTILYAAGSVFIGNWLEEKAQAKAAWKSAMVAFPLLILLLAVPLIPFVVPILPVEKLVPYVGALGVDAGVRTEDEEITILPQHYADRFGWEELVSEMAVAYEEATTRFGPDVGILVENWGQAGAVHHFGPQYGMPESACFNGWYYFHTLNHHQVKDTYVTAGLSKGELDGRFEHVELASMHTHPYCLPAENNNPIYICNSPRFDFGRMLQAERELNPDFAAVLEQDGVTAAIEYYYQQRAADPDVILFTERQLNTLGYEYLGREQVAEAIALFQLNVDVYPWAFNTYDSLAEAYMVNGQYDLAVEFYQKSLELNPRNDNAVDKLEELAELIATDNQPAG